MENKNNYPKDHETTNPASQKTDHAADCTKQTGSSHTMNGGQYRAGDREHTGSQQYGDNQQHGTAQQHAGHGSEQGKHEWNDSEEKRNKFQEGIDKTKEHLKEGTLKATDKVEHAVDHAADRIREKVTK